MKKSVCFPSVVMFCLLYFLCTVDAAVGETYSIGFSDLPELVSADGAFHVKIDDLILFTINGDEVGNPPSTNPEQYKGYLMEVPEEAYSSCMVEQIAMADLVDIGSYSKSPLNIPIYTTAIKFDNLVSFEPGNYYYFSMYSDSLCNAGKKFTLYVVTGESSSASSSTSVGSYGTSVMSVPVSTVTSSVPVSTVTSSALSDGGATPTVSAVLVSSHVTDDLTVTASTVIGSAFSVASSSVDYSQRAGVLLVATPDKGRMSGDEPDQTKDERESSSWVHTPWIWGVIGGATLIINLGVIVVGTVIVVHKCYRKNKMHKETGSTFDLLEQNTEQQSSAE